MRSIIKRTISFTLMALVTTLGIFALIQKPITKPGFDDDNFIKTSAFTNNFFSANLTSSGRDAADTFISFQAIYDIINPQIEAVVAQIELDDEITKEQIETLVNSADATISSQINALVGSSRVNISTAEELYYFSVSAAFNFKYEATENWVPFILTIQKILDLDYVLTSDIDYNTERARKFVPIGIDININNGGIVYPYPFTGTFDGQGFTISNLYVADYNYIIMLYGDTTFVDIPLARYYAMFAHVGTSGAIMNLVLRNPDYELVDLPDGLNSAAMLVGENKGLIYNTAVIDFKTSSTGADLSGMRINVQAATADNYNAAGFVHTNIGIIRNSYLATPNVLSASSYFRFEDRPFVYFNTATINDVVYNGTLQGIGYDSVLNPNVSSTVQPAGVVSYTTATLRNGTGVNINSQTLTNPYTNALEKNRWYFYADDGYPTMVGLTYNTNNPANPYFEISNEYDFYNFSKMIDFNTKKDTKGYNEFKYVLTKDIDMKNIKSYKTPSKPFLGILTGGDLDFSDVSVNINQNKYVYNLRIIRPAIVNTEYFLGVLSVVNGQVNNINFYNNELVATNTKEHYGKTFNIGMVAGRTTQTAIIKNIIVGNDSSAPTPRKTIDLGTALIGRTYAGGVIGRAGGNITYVAHTGIVDGGLHSFEDITIDGTFSIGGIIGGTATSNMILRNSYNSGQIYGVGSIDNEYAGTIRHRIGGVIGEINNLNSTGNELYYVLNTGDIHGPDFLGKDGNIVTYNIGGIFGTVLGQKNRINQGTNLINGRWENRGDVIVESYNAFNRVYTAGIGIAETTQSDAEFSVMNNKGNYSITGLNSDNYNVYVFYAATILDNTTTGIKLSRAYNDADYVFESSFFTTTVSTNPILISPFYTSVNNNQTTLLYVKNSGDLRVGTVNQSIALVRELRVSNITQNYFTYYKNVINSGNIHVTDFAQDKDVYVSGLTWILPYSDAPYTMYNVLNEGNIIVSRLSGHTVISGNTYTDTSFRVTTFVRRNIYISGIVNINAGVIQNAMNNGNLSSDDGLALTNITGRSNLFAGGITTFNYNLIQDTGNVGDLTFTNETLATDTSAVVHAVISTGNAYYGGLVFSYNSGITLGGITAIIGDRNALVLTGYGYGNSNILARVYDSANNGKIYAKAPEYVRVGGILGTALGTEITAGNNVTNSTDSGSTALKTFSTNTLGDQDPVGQSELSNGLNFGDIYGITSQVVEYNGSNSTANSERIPIHASVGGVIGYGLAKLTKMVNHGLIASTDVAGGVIGATFILGAANGLTTTVNIDTAIHYGKVRALKKAAYSNFTIEKADPTIGDAANFFYPINDTVWVTPSGTTAIAQNRKRGFGGIFGRLQRGFSGTMLATSFKNILNMDREIDMLGRVDQVSLTGSYYTYRFTSINNPDTYYTAKPYDITPSVFTGFTNIADAYVITQSTSVTFRKSTNNSTTLSSVTFNGATVSYGRGLLRYVGVHDDSKRRTFTFTGTQTPQNGSATYNVSARVEDIPFISTTSWTTLTITNYKGFIPIRVTTTNVAYPVPVVRDRALDPSDPIPPKFVFDEDFPLMLPEQSDYIYPVETDSLAPRFTNSGDTTNFKPNGMYVLATRLGKLIGAVMPSNIDVSNFYTIDEVNQSGYIDLNNVNSAQTKMPSIGDLGLDPLYQKYSAMFQVSYNNQSNIDTTTYSGQTVARLALKNTNGTGPQLDGGVISGTTITYTLPSQAFSGNNHTYEIDSATLSKNAVLANYNRETNPNFTAFNNAYLSRTSNVLGGTFKPIINGVFNADGIAGNADDNVITVKLNVFSEISSNISGLVEKYSTEYTIKIVRTTNTPSVATTQVFVDGAASTRTVSGNVTTVTSPQLLPNGTIQAVFTDTGTHANGTIMPLGHQMVVRSLYQGATLIDPSLYTVTINPKASNNQFGFNITLSSELINGSYSIRYSYFPNSTELSLSFTKQASNLYEVTNVDYDTFSVDNENTSVQFVPTNTNFTTFMEFGYQIAGIPYRTSTQSVSITYTPTTYTNTGVNIVRKYTLSLGGTYIMDVSFSPYATLYGVTAWYTYDNGIRQYHFQYTLRSQVNSPSGATNIITHTIRERTLDIPIIYKNGNQQFTTALDVDRQSSVTEFEFDFNFAGYSEFYGNVITQILKAGSPYSPSSNDIQFGFGSMYEVFIYSSLETGVKTYNFYLQREGGSVNYLLYTVTIDKLIGTDAYLKDIRFQIDEGSILYYPTIFESDTNGNIIMNSDYDARVFFDGISYDGADEANKKSFRINGIVSNIDITSYYPNFTLPIGATIQRFNETTGSFTNDLYGNYIPEDDSEFRIVQYRVWAENGTNFVDYFITVEDKNFTVTIKFNIYFRTTSGVIEASDAASPIKQSVILINVRNYKLNYDLGAPIVPTAGNVINETNGINTRTTLFIVPAPEGINNYLYTLGRNMTGAYGFNIVAPKYLGTTNLTDPSKPLVNGLRYDYNIYFIESQFIGTTSWNDNQYKLPNLDSTGETLGKYYYTPPGSLRQIKIEFAIVIENYTVIGNQWGLYDDYTSWDGN
ncbi:hypothetical protein N7603_07890 [Acholeplasma vituli]|uniref:Uncharacterized protein n=1 Tax=Paracholeplasma vituli TaxID=69473 RepID=A0ABT2Q0Y8_9MOLU|nr:hypothetical protein [Paracholeplasma vituli]MCU0105578.1 hypothetical protein [Paracholeplasma vituli]